MLKFPKGRPSMVFPGFSVDLAGHPDGQGRALVVWRYNADRAVINGAAITLDQLREMVTWLESDASCAGGAEE